MKKLVTTVLAATLATSIIAPQVQAKEDIKVKNSKLVDKKGNVIKGFKTYKGKVYKNSKLFKGVYKGKFYSKGKKSSGTYKGVKYHKGSIFTGKSVDGKYYDGGQVADGVASNGIMYDNGLIYTGSYAGVNYINGKPVMDKVDEDNKVDEPVIDDKEDDVLPPVVDETKPTEDNENSNDNNNDSNTTAPEVINPIPNPTPSPIPTPEETKPEDNNNESNENTTAPPDNTEETNPPPPVEEVKPPVTEQPSDNDNNNNTGVSDELVLIDGKLYVNPKTGVHYVNGKVQTTPYQYDKKSSQGYFFTSEGKLDVVFSNEDYRIYDLTDVLLSFHVYTNNQIEDVYMWEKERSGLQDNINSLPDSNPKKYLQGEYNKAIQVAIDTYNNHQATLKEKVNDLFKGTHPYYFKEGKSKDQLDNYLKDIDDEDFKKQITEMVNNATEPPSN